MCWLFLCAVHAFSCVSSTVTYFKIIKKLHLFLSSLTHGWKTQGKVLHFFVILADHYNSVKVLKENMKITVTNLEDMQILSKANCDTRSAANLLLPSTYDRRGIVRSPTMSTWTKNGFRYNDVIKMFSKMRNETIYNIFYNY